MAVPALVDQFGFAIAAPYGSARLMNAATSGHERPAYPLSLASINRVVPAWDWRTIVSVSRRLYANMGVPRGAIQQKAAFSVGRAWSPKFEGEDKAWGKLATEWLANEWFAMCNIRGSMFDFKTDLFLGSISVDRDGDFGVLLTEGETGYPMLQYIPAHRIGCRYTDWSGGQTVGANDAKSYVTAADGETRIEVRGAFAGRLIENGVIYNEIGRPIAYRILGSTQPDDVDVMASDFIHIFDPEWMDQGRGFPAFAHACNDFRDMLQSQEWEQIAQLIASSLGIQEHNETGAYDPNDAGSIPPATLGASGDLLLETIKGGRIKYFRAGSNSKIDSFAPDRPTELWSGFWDRLIMSAMAGINWPVEMVWKGGQGNAANERSQMLRAQSSIDDRQDLLRGPARRMVGYGVSKAIKLGILPPYPGKDLGGQLKWGFNMPRLLSIDRGRDGQGRRDDYKLGSRNLTDILSEDGTTLEAHRETRQMEITDTIRRAQKIASETGIEFDLALQLFEQRSPNPIMPTDTADAPEATVDTPPAE